MLPQIKATFALPIGIATRDRVLTVSDIGGAKRESEYRAREESRKGKMIGGETRMNGGEEENHPLLDPSITTRSPNRQPERLAKAPTLTSAQASRMQITAIFRTQKHQT